MMKPSPKLSMIIPTLNEEKYIGRLLECLSNQTFKDFEVIVVDGQSEDNTLAVIGLFKSRLVVKVIKSDVRKVSYQRNLGAQNSSGFHLLFLDADVTFRRNFLSKAMKKIDGKNRICVPKYHPSDKRWYYHLFFGIINSYYYLFQPITPGGIGSCVFSNKKIHAAVNGFDERFNWNDDLVYIKRAAKKFKYKILDVPIYVSVRRFEKDGTKKTMMVWVYAFFSVYFGRNKSDKVRYFEL